MLRQRKKSSLFLLQLKEERLITQAAINNGIHPSGISGLDNVFIGAKDPFDGLGTAYLQDKFVADELGYVVSMYNNALYCCKL